MRLTSSLGANDSDLPAFWNEIVDHLEGYAWPDADTDRLRDAASAWRSAADDVEGLAVVLRLRHLPPGDPGLPRDPARDRRPFATCAALWATWPPSSRSVGDACDDYADCVDEHRAIIRAIVADMAVEAGLTLAAGAVIGFFTVGGGAAAGAAIAGWRIASAAKKILATLRALEALAKARAVARLTSVVARVRPLRKVLERLRSRRRLRTGEKPGSPAGTGPHDQAAAHAGRPARPGDPAADGRVRTGKGGWPTTEKAKSGNDPVRRRRRLDPHHGSQRTATRMAACRFYNSEISPSTWTGSRRATERHAHPDQCRRHLPVPKGWNP